MTSTKKTKQKATRKALQASPAKTSVMGKGRLKRPSADLGEVMSWANLVPPQAVLPERLIEPTGNYQDMVNSIYALPADLREHLLGILNADSKSELDLTFQPRALRMGDVLTRYTNIRNARRAFDEIFDYADRIDDVMIELGYFWLPIRSDAVARLSSGWRLEFRLEKFADALQGVDIRYLRKCAREACQRVFFAPRIYSDRAKGAGCSRACNKKLRNDRWKKSYKEGRKY